MAADNTKYIPDESKGEVNYDKVRAAAQAALNNGRSQSDRDNAYERYKASGYTDKTAYNAMSISPTSTLSNGNTRTYSGNGSSYSDTRADGSQAGAGMAGTENWGTTGGNMADISAYNMSGGGTQGVAKNAVGGAYQANKTSSVASRGNNTPQFSNSTPQSSISSQLEQLKKAQLAATMAGLDKSKNASLSNLSAESAKIDPQYYAARNTASTQSQLGAKNFSEYMAQRGQTNSGVASQGEIANNVSLQGNLGSLNTQQMADNSDIARRTTGVNNAYESDVAGANANVESQYLQNYIAQMNADRGFGLQEAGITGNYNGQQTMQARQYDTQNNQWDRTFNSNQEQNQFNNGIATAGLTGQYNGTQTMQGKQSDASIASSNASTNLNVAQLKEMQDPNSVTNQLKQIGLDTARLNFAELPEQLKMQAQGVAQDLAMGKISLQTAQIQLDNLPAQLAASLASTNRSNTGGSGGSRSSGGSSGGSTTTATANKAAATTEASRQISAAIQGGMTPSQIQEIIVANKATFTEAGLSITKLKEEAYREYQNYHKENHGYIPM